jgi:hypothetical protein
MTWLHSFGMLLILATVGLTLVAVVALFVRRRWATRIGLALIGWYALHLGFVAAVSAGIPERRLAPGEVKRFCGFYLDCHLGAAVAESHRAGAKQFVTLEISSTARAATLTPYGLTARLVDDAGRRFEPEPTGPLEQPLAPGASYRKELVFDVPPDAHGLALDVRERGLPDDWIELFLAGDDDSFLHKPVLLELAG